MKIIHKIGRRIPELVVALVWLYVLVPFLAPLAYSNGYESVGWGINEFYEQFCHQRVERSVFLLGKEKPLTFYTVGELKDAQVIPQVNPDPVPFQWPEYFGHDYVGNEQVGWKVPLCIRDIALYGGLALAGSLIVWWKRKNKELKVSKWTILALTLPMMIDGIALTVISLLKLDWVPGWFIYSNLKRIITGALFGAGIALLIIPPLFPSKKLTKRK
jgi:uncharacterized membrane protein